MMMMMTNHHQEHRQEQEEHARESELSPFGEDRGQADHLHQVSNLQEVEGAMMWAPLLLQDIIRTTTRSRSSCS